MVVVNLRRLAVLLAGMGWPLPPMVRALLPHTPPRGSSVPVPASLILGNAGTGKGRASWHPGLSGNAHQRRIERRRLGA